MASALWNDLYIYISRRNHMQKFNRLFGLIALIIFHWNFAIHHYDHNDTIDKFLQTLTYGEELIEYNHQKTWRKYLKDKDESNPKHQWHDILTLYVTRHCPPATIEKCTTAYVSKLQDDVFFTLGLTARERKAPKITSMTSQTGLILLCTNRTFLQSFLH